MAFLDSIKYQCTEVLKCCRDPVECKESLGLYLGNYKYCDNLIKDKGNIMITYKVVYCKSCGKTERIRINASEVPNLVCNICLKKEFIIDSVENNQDIFYSGGC